MKFGKTLHDKTLKEWRFYSVDYHDLKTNLKEITSGDGKGGSTDEFFNILEQSEAKLERFYHDKESWAVSYMETLEKRVEELRESASSPGSPVSPGSPSSSLSSDESASSDEETNASPTGIVDFQKSLDMLAKKDVSKLGNFEWLKDEYRRMGKSKHFQDFIYSKKSLTTFQRELGLLLEFLELNKTAFSKILKKFDKHTGSTIRQDRLDEILQRQKYLNTSVLKDLHKKTIDLIDEVNSLKPRLPEGWENRKVYTIGCFDLFHRGHQNVLISLREFGYYVSVKSTLAR